MWVLVSCTLVTTLYATTITIANVSLPQIQGAMSASPDQVAWVITANLIATAVTIPAAGWLSARLGRRRAMIWGVSGFTVATVMCGLSTSLEQLVLWRVVQSACGSPLTPISQSVVIDAFPGEKRGPAMAVYGLGVVMGPTIAPLLGGYVSQELSWRWVFFILVPMAMLALAGLLLALKETRPPDTKVRLDWTGFVSLSVAVSCIQLMLDRGERLEWFTSTEIVVEACVAAVAAWVFVAHSLTRERPFLDPRLLLNRNFAVGLGISLIFGALFVTPMVLLPVLLQQLRGIPEFTIATLMAARGLGTFVSQLLMVVVSSRWTPRTMLLIGFGAHTAAGLQMMQFDVNVTLTEVAISNAVQGFGVGFLWVPITLVLFSEFDPRRTAEGSGMFHFVRSVASSYFISFSFVLAFHTSKMSYSNLVQWISPYNAFFAHHAGGWDLGSEADLLRLSGEVTRQAVTIGYLNAFHLFTWVSFAVYPLIALIRWPPRPRG
ncbi:MAG: DHA2 family efflux MFS transporter permease subunit [Ectothiorhodospiraceae bacterium]|nr:DHA2 family efflux MFS transporter permease subunit [Chromatiales bacterium]MCP5154081.1 DHA2 family efflux MFS transporter permease subunit [Ectothiorhodospiraceae bacterium]